HGKFAGRYVSGADELQRAIDRGFRFLQTGTELNLMAAGAQQLLAPLGRARPANDAAIPY
ncbi:MAG: aldolase, partial [Verrucomicrobiae bacterium]|nr:aldolase [Verrucomicrobiae bacterium]